MFQKFIEHLQVTCPDFTQQRFLLAVSGGIDSVVLCAIFADLLPHDQLGIAHCNFNLRAEASLKDAQFVRELADKKNISFFSKSFETTSYASLHKVSIQIAARELRYGWFEELLVQEGFDYLVTAHHLDDNIETFLMHTIRGTGLQGLLGIPKVNDKKIRPMLGITKLEIQNYAAEKQLEWVEDVTNSSTKYFRNKIRHLIVPMLKEENTSFDLSFQRTLTHLEQSKSLVEDAVAVFKENYCTYTENGIQIHLEKAKKLTNINAYLYEVLQGYGFTAWNDIYALVDAATGKYSSSSTHRVLKNRSHLLIEPLQILDFNEIITISEEVTKIIQPISITFEKSVNCKIEPTPANEIRIDAERIAYPLLLRKWQQGDYFYPLGMQGKKKLSKYFKDEKWSLFDKEKAWVLTTANNELIWIVGHRADDRFKINPLTKTIVKIKLNS